MNFHKRDFGAVLTLLMFVVFAHHRVMLFGEQPVGGDKTAFFYGLMANYGTALKAGHLPYWNANWGFGFPGVAESQIGAFYWPHLLLFRWLDADNAFRWNYIAHHLAIAVAAYLGFRWMRLQTLGAWIAALAYIGGGFATIHFDHQWAVESMTWLPLIVAATFQFKFHRSRWATCLLPALIAIQLTIGHFQIAFVALSLAGLIAIQPPEAKRNRLTRWLGDVFGFLLLVGIGFCIAGPQVAMTYELQCHIRVANPNALNRDYLANFALPTDRLLNLFWPMLYFREPLWREVAWDPFKTSPEECLNYVGLAPLFFALASVRSILRRRVVAIGWTLLFVSTVLALGPYTPLFAWTSQLPGFGYFRCPARWTLGMEFALGLLGGWQIDRWQRPGMAEHSRRRGLRRLPMAGISVWLLSGVALAGGWFAAFKDNSLAIRGLRATTALFTPSGWQKPFDDLPHQLATPREWSPMTIRQWLDLERHDRPFSLRDSLAVVLRREIMPTAAIGLLALAHWPMIRRRRAWVVGFLAVDLAVFAWLFMDRSCPNERIDPPGELLTELKSHASKRVLAPGANFTMAAGLSPVRAYRTLDVPWPPAFFPLLDRLESLHPDAVRQAEQPPFALFGIGLAISQIAPEPSGDSPPATKWFDDRQLDWWLDGNDGKRRFLEQRMARSPNKASTGSLVVELPHRPMPAFVFARSTVDLRGAVLWRPSLLGITKPAIAQAMGGLYDAPNRQVGKATLVEELPLERVYAVECSEPASLVIGELFLPGWTATAQAANSNRSATIELGSCDGYWQAASLPAAGQWTVTIRYDPPGRDLGLAMACVGVVLWFASAARCALARR